MVTRTAYEAIEKKECRYRGGEGIAIGGAIEVTHRTSHLAKPSWTCRYARSLVLHTAIDIFALLYSIVKPNMSTFGAPGAGIKITKPIPPERGSFPLDHDAECQPIMKKYLACLKSVKGTNAPECRELSKGYLQCRMERNLMAPDSMKNLGFGNGEDGARQGQSGEPPEKGK